MLGSTMDTVPLQSPEDVCIVADVAVVADGIGGLKLIGIENPEQPIKMGAVVTPANALGVAVQGQIAYVAVGEQGLQVVDASDPYQRYRLTVAGKPPGYIRPGRDRLCGRRTGMGLFNGLAACGWRGRGHRCFGAMAGFRGSVFQRGGRRLGVFYQRLMGPIRVPRASASVSDKIEARAKRIIRCRHTLDGRAHYFLKYPNSLDNHPIRFLDFARLADDLRWDPSASGVWASIFSAASFSPIAARLLRNSL